MAVLKSPQGTAKVPLSKLSTTQIIKLVGKAAEGGAEGRLLDGLALMAYYEGKLRALLPQLRKLSDTASYRETLDKLDVTVREGQTEEAERTWKTILKLARKGNWRGLSEALASFERAFDRTSHLESRRDLFGRLRATAIETAKTNRVLNLVPGGRIVLEKPPRAKETSLTVETQIRTRSRGVVVVERGADLLGYSLIINRDGYPCFLVRQDGRSLTALRGNLPVDDDKFHHLAGILSLEDGKAALLVDGVKVAERESRGIQGEPEESLTIGSPGEQGSLWGYSLTGSLTGQLDEIRVWNFARPTEDVARDRFRRLTGKEPGLTAYWNFDASARDLSSGRNHLELDRRAKLVESPWQAYLPPLPEEAGGGEVPAEIQALKTAAEKLFKGKAKVHDDGTIDFVYTFSDFKEGRDWVPQPGALYKISGGHLRPLPTKYGGNLWHYGRFVGDVALELRAKTGEGLSCLLKSSGSRRRSTGAGFWMGMGERRGALVWGEGIREEVPIDQHLDLNEFCDIRTSMEDRQVRMTCNGDEVVKASSERLLVGGGGLIALTPGRGGMTWDRLRLTGRLDARWVKSELSRRKYVIEGRNYALKFSSYESWLSVPPIAGATSGPFTWEAWFLLSRKTNIGLFASSGINQSMWLGITKDQKLCFRASERNRTPVQLFSAPEEVPLGEWFHLAAVSDGKEGRVYVNGKMCIQDDFPRSVQARDFGFSFGGKGNGRFTAGILDELRLSRTARYTEDFEPQRVSEADKDTVALFHFDEGQGPRCLDEAGGVIGVQTKETEWVHVDSGVSAEVTGLWQAAERGDPEVAIGLEMNGTDAYVSFKDTPKLNLKRQITIEVWARVRRQHVWTTGILDRSSSGRRTFGLLSREDGTIHFAASDPKGGYHYVATGRLPASPFLHLAATFDRGRARIFLNGKLQEEKKWPFKELVMVSGAPLTLGKLAGQRGGFFSGRIYQARISNGVRYERASPPPRIFERDRGTVVLLPINKRRSLQVTDAVPARRRIYSGLIYNAKWVPDRWE